MSKSGASKKADESSPANEKSCDDSLDKEVKFDRELDWCIQKLNTRLLNEKDSKKGTKHEQLTCFMNIIIFNSCYHYFVVVILHNIYILNSN